MKVIGAALVLFACTGLGFRIARGYRERPRQLRAVTQGIRLLKNEIEFSVTPLPQALRKVGTRSAPPVGQLFLGAADGLQTADASVAEAFAAAVERLLADSVLRSSDCSILSEFGQTLGTSDRLHQSQHIEVTLASLESAEREAVELQKRNERLWQYLGVLTGLLLLILLY